MLEISACAPPSARYDRRVRQRGSGEVKTRRRSGLRITAVVTVIVAALWSQSPPAGATVPPGRIVSLIPSDDEISRYVGLPVTQIAAQGVRPRPQDHLSERDECRTLIFDTSVDVWGTDYTAFRSQNWTYQPDPTRAFVSQAVGTFSSAGSARDRVHAVYNPNLFNSCNHAQFNSPDGTPGATFELFDFKVDDPVILWTLAAKNYGQYNGYNYVFVIFYLDNVMSISAVGQVGNPNPVVKRLTDYILSRVG